SLCSARHMPASIRENMKIARKLRSGIYPLLHRTLTASLEAYTAAGNGKRVKQVTFGQKNIRPAALARLAKSQKVQIRRLSKTDVLEGGCGPLRSLFWRAQTPAWDRKPSCANRRRSNVPILRVPLQKAPS